MKMSTDKKVQSLERELLLIKEEFADIKTIEPTWALQVGKN